MLSEMEICPNPVADVLNVSLSKVDADYSCAIFNQAGQKIQEGLLRAGQDGKLSFNTSELPAGVYILSIQSSKGLYISKKFVKAE